mgnify:CR=1 FL=1
MVREDILGGLRNALERGETLEQARQSFINSGYPEKEVDEAAASVGTEKEGEKFIPIPEKAKDKDTKKQELKSGEIKELIDISKLKSNEIKEVPMPPLPGKKSGFPKFMLIFGGSILILALIGFIIVMLTKSLDMDILNDLKNMLK